MMPSVIRISASKLNQHDPQTLWGRLSGVIDLGFDDGEVVRTTGEATLVSMYAWGLIRENPVIGLVSRYHICSMTDGRSIRPDTIRDLLARVRTDLLDRLRSDIREDHPLPYMHSFHKLSDYVHKRCMDLHGYAYNDMSTMVPEFVTSLDAEDMLEIYDHPDVARARSVATHDAAGLKLVNEAVRYALMKCPTMDNNSAALAVRSGAAKREQAVQCLGWRGYLTDVDGSIVNTPICRGFFEGLSTVGQILQESRSAAKSLRMAKDDLQNTEYSSRRLQLLAMSVRRLHQGDCWAGHDIRDRKQYLEWPEVRPERSAGGTRRIRSDLDVLAGKYYLDEEAGQLKVIRPWDKFLLGRRNLRIRSVLACRHRDPAGFCETCFGRGFYGTNYLDNPGHKSVAEIMEKASQRVLSNKHYEGSAVVEVVELPSWVKKYMILDQAGCSYYLVQDEVRGAAKYGISIKESNAPDLTDLDLVQDPRSMNIRRISKIPNFTLEIETGDGMKITQVIDCTMMGRVPSFNGNFLQYIRSKKGMEPRGDGTLYISLDEWDYSQAFLSLPMRQYSMAEHAKEIAHLIESSSEESENRAMSDPMVEIVGFSDKVNEQLEVAMGLLEIIFWACSVVDPGEGDHTMPKPWTTRALGVGRVMIAERSASPTLAFEGLIGNLLTPDTFIPKPGGRHDHPFDAFICPQEVYELERARGRAM